MFKLKTSVDSTLVILLLSALLWLAADFYGEYKKNNLTDQEKSELRLKQSQEALIDSQKSLEIQKLISTNFNDVALAEKPMWVFEQMRNSLAARFALAALVIGGFGYLYMRKTDQL